MNKSREPQGIPITDFGKSGNIPGSKARQITKRAAEFACLLTFVAGLEDPDFTLFRQALPNIPGDIDGMRTLLRGIASIRETRRLDGSEPQCFSKLCPTLQYLKKKRLEILRIQKEVSKNGR